MDDPPQGLFNPMEHSRRAAQRDRSRPDEYDATRLVVAAALAFVSHLAVAQSAPENLEVLRERSLELVNESRRQEGLEALELGAELNEAAQNHAEDMLERDFYAHVTPEGGTVMDRYQKAGGSENRLVAENIAQCRNCAVPADAAAVEELHQGWMNSPEHRENILAEGLAEYGFGLAENESGTRYSVQTFAGPGVPRGLEAGGTAKPIDDSAQTDLAVSLINERRSASSISAAPRLIEAARAVIPDAGLSDVSLEELNPLGEALPADAPWRSFQMIVGSCGGCGAVPTDADVRSFISEWLGNDGYKAILEDPALSRLGMVIKADGDGRKIAVGILAGD